jgi:RNA polymerase sigma-70 factor (ECF subfamily)
VALNLLEIEAAAERAWTAGDLHLATTVLIRGYGPQVVGYLIGVLEDKQDASDGFAEFCADLWKTLASFRRECTFQAWCFMVARHAAVRLREKTKLRRKRTRPLTPEDISNLGGEVFRSSTASRERRFSETESRLERLRKTLSEDEQTLLFLRVDRDLSWRDIARVLADAADSPPSEVALRKRFERLKQKLELQLKQDVLPPP